MQYAGVFDLANANSGSNAYSNNKLYFQTWLTELQARMEKHDMYKHVIIRGVHPGYVSTNIWIPAKKDSPQKAPPQKSTWRRKINRFLLKYYAIDAQQGSLAITNAATAVDLAPEGRYFNRLKDEKPMPQTTHPDCRRQIWLFVSEELKLEDKGLLTELGL
jgi:NAD(P)-dependent dehydrogenase (short-subunit alcohol dehydrogenase family)